MDSNGAVIGFTIGILLTSIISRSLFALKKHELCNYFDGNEFLLEWNRSGSFSSRLAKLLYQCDPLKTFLSDKWIKTLIKNFIYSQDENNMDKTVGDRFYIEEQMTRKILIESAVKPGTTDLVPKPFRMSGYLIFNGPVCIALSMSTSIETFLFWSWVNQSQAALVNYFNLPSKSVNLKEIVIPYIIAVTGALLSSIGIVAFIENNMSLSEDEASLLLKLLPLPSNGIAAMLNCYSMSYNLLKKGAKLVNETKPLYSKVAARKLVKKTMFIRSLLPIPCFLVPTLILQFTSLLTYCDSPFSQAMVEVMVCTISFGIGLPIFLSIFPEFDSMKREDAEPEISRLANQKLLIFHRGL